MDIFLALISLYISIYTEQQTTFLFTSTIMSVVAWDHHR